MELYHFFTTLSLSLVCTSNFHLYITANASQLCDWLNDSRDCTQSHGTPNAAIPPLNTSCKYLLCARYSTFQCWTGLNHMQLLCLEVLLSTLFLGGKREELAKPPLVLVPFFVLTTTFQHNLELTAPFSLSSPPAAGPWGGSNSWAPSVANEALICSISSVRAWTLLCRSCIIACCLSNYESDVHVGHGNGYGDSLNYQLITRLTYSSTPAVKPALAGAIAEQSFLPFVGVRGVYNVLSTNRADLAGSGCLLPRWGVNWRTMVTSIKCDIQLSIYSC